MKGCLVAGIALTAMPLLVACGENHAATIEAAASFDAAGDADEGSVLDASADTAGVCDLSAYNPVLVCFGSDPAAYQKYLLPDAGGGICPATKGFLSSSGEGSCGYAACGPLPNSAVPADAGLDGGSISCCFWVVRVCGV
jgi:hypothetical protein